jgi:hypothetical protein
MSFTRFITASFVRVIYIVVLVVIVLAWLVAIVNGFGQGVGLGLLSLVGGGLAALLYIILVRVGLEFAVAMIRTAENTGVLARRR